MAENSTMLLPYITVFLCVCSAPHQVDEFVLTLPAGTTVLNALTMAASQGITIGVHQNSVSHPNQKNDDASRSYGVWGRIVGADAVLLDQDRLEIYRPLVVDPKHARRERFSRQGARSAGLFEKRRPGAKAGY